jgi:hypothetical protein
MPKFEYPTTTPGQLSARSGNPIAVTELVSRKSNGDITKTEVFYIIYVADTNKIVIRNEKKELLTASISFLHGLQYGTKSDYKFLAQLIELSQNTAVINTSLGLDWIIPVFKVHYHIQMIRQSATTTDILYADLDVWEHALNLVNIDDKNEIIDKLVSVIKYQLTTEQLKSFELFKVSANNTNNDDIIDATVIDGKDAIPDSTDAPDKEDETTDPTGDNKPILFLSAALDNPIDNPIDTPVTPVRRGRKSRVTA